MQSKHNLSLQPVSSKTCNFFSLFFQNFTDWFSISERCDTPDSLQEKGCAKDWQEFPVSNSQILQDLPLGRKTSKSNSTQISPQKMALKLRPGMQSEAFCYFVFTDGSSYLDSNKLIVLFMRRQSDDHPSQSSTDRGLSCGHVLPDGPFRVHDWWFENDQGLGLDSV